MGRVVGGVVAGLIAWFVIATLGDVLLRMSWHGYADAVPAMAFTLPMLLGRLLLGALSSIGAGVVATWIAKAATPAAYILGALLVVLFIPIHIGLWDRLPVWYHLVFLVSLAPLVVAGARLMPPRV